MIKDILEKCNPTNEALFERKLPPKKSLFKKSERARTFQQYAHRVESDLSSWLTKQLTLVPRDPSVEFENIAQGKLKIHTDEFRVKAEKIIEDKRFKRSEVVNLSTESIQAVIEAYATIVKDLDDQLATLKAVFKVGCE